MTKEAENDKESIMQLFHTFNTAFTKFPTPHTVNTLKAGSGKNYLVNKIVASYYPQRYIIEYNRLSDKALFHRPGIEVIAHFDEKTGEEVTVELQPILAQLYFTKKILEDKKELTPEEERQLDAIENEIDDLNSRAEKLMRSK